MKVLPVANLAHGGGAVMGILMGYAISVPRRRALAIAGSSLFLAFTLWAATYGRPVVNLSASRGQNEGYLGYRALMENRNADSVRWFREAIKYRPHEQSYWFNLMIAFRRLKDGPGELAACRRAAEEGSPSAQDILAERYEAGREGVTKDLAQAAFWYRKAANQGIPGAQNDAAWFLLTASDVSLRDPVEALGYAEKAVVGSQEADGKRNPAYLDTLAEAYYANRRVNEALQTEQEAIKIDQEMLSSIKADEGLSPYHNEYKARLAKYQRALNEKASRVTLK
jgi:tetratricopeptide (TPR) repeat protein